MGDKYASLAPASPLACQQTFQPAQRAKNASKQAAGRDPGWLFTTTMLSCKLEGCFLEAAVSLGFKAAFGIAAESKVIQPPKYVGKEIDISLNRRASGRKLLLSLLVAKVRDLFTMRSGLRELTNQQTPRRVSTEKRGATDPGTERVRKKQLSRPFESSLKQGPERYASMGGMNAASTRVCS